MVGRYRIAAQMIFPSVVYSHLRYYHRRLTCFCLHTFVVDAVSSDTELARDYELAIDSQFVPLGIYTREVDYTDIDVQVNGWGCHQGSHVSSPWL